MALKTISEFKTALARGGARPNLFEVELGKFGGIGPNEEAGTGTTGGDASTLGWDSATQKDFQFLCKATSMPTQTVGSVDVPFRGRILKVAGDRTFEPWTVTVINDENFSVRSAFEACGRRINDLRTGEGIVTPEQYMGSGTVKQLSRGVEQGAKDKILQQYMVQDIWPSEIGSIDLSYESSDAIEEFTVTFQVQYMTILGAGTEEVIGGTP